jgi:hypothetical protein
MVLNASGGKTQFLCGTPAGPSTGEVTSPRSLAFEGSPRCSSRLSAAELSPPGRAARRTFNRVFNETSCVAPELAEQDGFGSLPASGCRVAADWTLIDAELAALIMPAGLVGRFLRTHSR